MVLVKEAVSNVEALILRQPLQLIEEIFRRFSHPGWATTPRIRTTILKQIARKAKRLLEAEHPLVVITDLLLSPSTLNDAASATFQAISDTASQKLDKGNEDLFAVQQDIADCFNVIGDLDNAEIICQRSLAQSAGIFPETHYIRRNIKRDLGQVRFKHGHWSDAERLWLEVIDLTVQDKGQANVGAIGLSTCECLATMYKERSDYQNGARYYRLALQGALDRFGPKDVDVLAYFDCVVEMLKKEGDIEGMSQLYRKYEGVVEERQRREEAGACKL